MNFKEKTVHHQQNTIQTKHFSNKINMIVRQCQKKRESVRLLFKIKLKILILVLILIKTFQNYQVLEKYKITVSFTGQELKEL